MKSRALSHDHHYIPQCYLRGFCRADGTFDVYDKHYGKFKKLPQSPATSFFERGRNTILFQGERSDQVEKLYARLESGIGNLFNHIRSGASSESLLKPEGIYLAASNLKCNTLPQVRCHYATQNFVPTASA